MRNRISLAVIISSILFCWASVQAGNATDSVKPQEVEMEGVVTSENSNEVTVHTHQGTEFQILLPEGVEIEEKKSNPFRSAKKYSREDLVAGLNIFLEGTMVSPGVIRAEEIKFTQDALRVAKTISSRVSPLQKQLSETKGELAQTSEQLEKSTSKLSGDVEELSEAYRVAREEAAKAQSDADEAVSRIESAEHRITSLDSFSEVMREKVTFGFDSYELSDEARQKLDAFTRKVSHDQGYLLEVRGYASPEGPEAYNRRLSLKRADAVVSYLVEEQGVPLRRILRPYGFGEIESTSEDTASESAAPHRKVEVRVLKSAAYMDSEQQSASLR